MSEELARYESAPLTTIDLKSQVDLIQDVMKKVMRDKEHYGIIPGCGDKPALLKPGAEKLNLTFRMAPDPETEIIDLGAGHREYRVKIIMRSIITGKVLGAGVGSASTMETKWRYRNAEPEISDRPVPKEYWDLRKENPNKALDLLGGKGFVPKKVDGLWMIGKLTGEKVEYDNPADYYNTCWKMAKKRSLVDAVLTVLGASDIFTQDVEEMVENGTITEKKESPHPPLKEPQKKATADQTGNKTIQTVITGHKEWPSKKQGGNPTYQIIGELDGNEQSFTTFSKTDFELAVSETGTGLPLMLEYVAKQIGEKTYLNIVSLKRIEPQE